MEGRDVVMGNSEKKFREQVTLKLEAWPAS